jgi:NAD(P)-dependent dehydrogenase (short-subunit alcohol dehydrogenase family)
VTADRTVVVTGAAGSIGAATVVRFLERGLTVLGIDRDDARPADARHHHVVVDLADADALQTGLDGALGRLPRVAHVVGIAGGALPEEPSIQDDIASMDPAVFRASLDANLVTQFILMRSVVRHLGQRSDEDRSICFTSSFNALSAQGMPAYSAAKAGILGMMYASVRPLGRLGIRVNVVAPGTVRTPRTERLWAAVPDHFARLEAGSALGRLAQPDDVAAAFAALALDLHHVTGQVLVVDGGQSAAHA